MGPQLPFLRPFNGLTHPHQSCAHSVVPWLWAARPCCTHPRPPSDSRSSRMTLLSFTRALPHLLCLHMNSLESLKLQGCRLHTVMQQKQPRGPKYK